jgi:hypothetical protein
MKTRKSKSNFKKLKIRTNSLINQLKNDKRMLFIVLVGILVISFAGYWSVHRSNSIFNPKAGNSPQTPTDEAEGSTTPQANNTDDSDTQPDATKPKPDQSSKVSFDVSRLEVHNPKPVGASTSFGTPYSACRVAADIEVSAAGSVEYYWEEYNDFGQNNNFVSDGSAQNDAGQLEPVPLSSGTLEFSQAGTKTVSIVSRVSDENRHFTIFISQPKALSTSTAHQAWCDPS